MKKNAIVKKSILTIMLFIAGVYSAFLSPVFAQTYETQELSPDQSFPNAIYINRQEIDGLLSGLNVSSPFGIVSLLSLNKGITFGNSGDMGAETWFNIRGFGRDNSRLVLVLLDGRPLNLATNHTVEFDDIPVNIVESITIYPGPVPAQYGGYQTVIDIKTIHNEELVQAKASVGSLHTYRLSTTVSNNGRFYYLANFEAELSKGLSHEQLQGSIRDFRYGDRSVYTVLPTLKAGYEISKNLDISVNGSFVDFKKLYNYEGYTEDPTYRHRRMQNYSLLLQPGKESSMDYMFSFFHNREKEFQDCIFPEQVTYAYNWGNQKRYLSGFRGYYRHSFAGLVALKAGGEAQWSKGNSDNGYLYFKYVDKQNFYSGFLQSELTLWSGGYINVGVRMDGQNDVSKTYFSPVLAAQQSFLDNQLAFYASYGVTSRWIPLNEVNTFERTSRGNGQKTLFVPEAYTGIPASQLVTPTFGLKMERTRAFDAGVKGKLFNRMLELGINYFNMRNEGQLGTPVFQLAGPAVSPETLLGMVGVEQNFPGYDYSQGMEFEIGYKPFRFLSFFANATYFIKCKTELYSNFEENTITYAELMAAAQTQDFSTLSSSDYIYIYDGKGIIPGTYKWLANAGVTYRPVEDAMVNLVCRYRSKMSDPIMKMNTTAEADHIPGFVTVDLAASYNILKKENYTVKATASAYNLFDKYTETFIHYPSIGRFLTAGVTVTFK